jgi:hypothetical protein
MVPVTAMIAANTNGGQMVNERRLTQDGADALAAMHATWTARSLNVLAMNAVTETQLLTVAIGSEALAGTLAEIGVAVGTVNAAVGMHIAQFCNTGEPISSAACAGLNGLVTLPADIIGGIALAMHVQYRPDHGMDVANRSLRAIEGMNRAIVERLPRAMSEIGADYARETRHRRLPLRRSLRRVAFAELHADQFRRRHVASRRGGERLDHLAAVLPAMDNGARFGFTTYRARGFGLSGGPMTTGGTRQPPCPRPHPRRSRGIDRLLKTFKDIYRNVVSRRDERRHAVPADCQPSGHADARQQQLPAALQPQEGLAVLLRRNAQRYPEPAEGSSAGDRGAGSDVLAAQVDINPLNPVPIFSPTDARRFPHPRAHAEGQGTAAGGPGPEGHGGQPLRLRAGGYLQPGRRQSLLAELALPADAGDADGRPRGRWPETSAVTPSPTSCRSPPRSARCPPPAAGAGSCALTFPAAAVAPRCRWRRSC